MSELNQEYQDWVNGTTANLWKLAEFFNFEINWDFERETPWLTVDVTDILDQLTGLIIDLKYEVENEL